MNSENQNNPENSSQNELNLGLNADPITPKKVNQPTASIFDKVKGLLGGKEDSSETQFHLRKEPNFGSFESAPQSEAQPETVSASEIKSPFTAGVATSATFSGMANAASSTDNPFNSSSVNSAQSAPFSANVNNQAESTAQTDFSSASASPNFAETVSESVNETANNTAETLAGATAATAAAASIKNPEKWKVLQILPVKHRRLFIALLALVAILLVIWLLKPNSDTVQSFEQQNSNEIPIQFQSMDPNNPVETGTIEPNTQPSAEQATVDQNTPAEQQNGTSDQPPANFNPQLVNSAQSAPTAQSIPSTQATEQTAQQAAKPAEEPKSVPAPAPAKPVAEYKPQVSHKAPVQQAEVHKEVVKPRVEKAAKTERKVQVVEAKPTSTVKREPKIVDAKPVGVKPATPATTTKAPAKTESVVAANRKTLTVQQGVSLMQVFRDNNLNISDVNAMTKAPGAGSTLSSFKPGDKVQVAVNAQGRVSELRLSDGSKFIRQANGTYQYSK